MVLSHSLHMMPEQKLGLGSDDDKVQEIIKTGSKNTFYRRDFCYELDFWEVETYMMNMVAGGAAIPLEIYFKELAGGGLDRVPEIGKQFRNEGIDLTPNPEFTTCESDLAFAYYNDLMKPTEDVLSGMVKELTGGYKIKYHANGFDNDLIDIDFTPPFRRIAMVDELKKMANLSIPKDLSSEEANKYQGVLLFPAMKPLDKSSSISRRVAELPFCGENYQVQPPFEGTMNFKPDFGLDSFSTNGTFSWIGSGCLCEVRNQYGTDLCWAIVASGNMFSEEVIHNRQLHRHDATVELGSVQELADRAHYFYALCPYERVTAKGLKNRMESAYMYAREFGLYPEVAYPFKKVCTATFEKGDPYPFGPLELQATVDNKIFVGSHGNLKSQDYDGIDKQLRIQPIGGAIKMSETFVQWRGTDIYTGPKDEYDTWLYDDDLHAVTIVGYGGRRGIDDFYIIQNSWGKGWGFNGYAKVSRSTIEENTISYPINCQRKPVRIHDLPPPRCLPGRI